MFENISQTLPSLSLFLFPTRNITSRLIQKSILEHQRSNTGTHQVLHYSKRATNQLRKYLVRLKRPLLAPASSRRVRFVHVSDTHNCHNHLRFHGTEGDVLLHTGDCVGNYRRENVHEHFKSFTKWLIEMSKKFNMSCSLRAIMMFNWITREVRRR